MSALESPSRMASMTGKNEIIAEIAKLPVNWHRVGSVSIPVLEAIAAHTGTGRIGHTAETGTGKTTLLFSHISADHKVFAHDTDDESMSLVRASPLLRRETVEFVVGPTQRTLPAWQSDKPLEAVLIDGPHGYPFPELEYYYFYPRLAQDALLIVDDIHIPTIGHLHDFLKEDEMFRLVDIVQTTAFFRRTGAALFDPEGDGWWLQEYNKKRFKEPAPGFRETVRRRVSPWIPPVVKRQLRALLK